MLNTSNAPSFDLAEWRKSSAAFQALWSAAAPASEQHGKQWVEARVAAAVARGGDAHVARRTYQAAQAGMPLSGSFTLRTASGQEVTVAELLSAPARWHGAEFLDPFEPDYDGGRATAKAFLAGQNDFPALHSFAHGSRSYPLMLDFSEMFADRVGPDWRPPVTSALSFSFGTFIDDGELPETEPEIIRELLPAGAGMVSFIAGQSGSGKTFYACGLAVHVAAGRPFLGHPCREAVGVVYIAAEGAGTIRERLHAAKRQAGIRGRLAIAVIPRCPNLADDAARAALLGEIEDAARQMIAQGLCRRVGLVVVDTLTMAFGVEDENSNSEATRVCQALRDMGQRLGCVVAPIHHYGKSKDGGLRGASAWRAAADHSVAILGDRNEASGEVTGRKVAVNKSRTGPEGPVCCFELQQIDLGTNRYDEPRSTCVFVRTDGDPTVRKSPKGRCTFDEAFDTVMKRGKTIVEDESGRNAVPVDDVRKEFMMTYPSDNEESTKRIWRRELMNAEKYHHRNGLLWRKEPSTFNEMFGGNVVNINYSR